MSSGRHVHVLTWRLLSVPGSVPSLAAGLLFGGLSGFGAYQISNDPKNIWVSLGWYNIYFSVCVCVASGQMRSTFPESVCGLPSSWICQHLPTFHTTCFIPATSGALTGVMAKRFYGSRKFMPAGLVAAARYHSFDNMDFAWRTYWEGIRINAKDRLWCFALLKQFCKKT